MMGEEEERQKKKIQKKNKIASTLRHVSRAAAKDEALRPKGQASKRHGGAVYGNRLPIGKRGWPGEP